MIMEINKNVPKQELELLNVLDTLMPQIKKALQQTSTEHREDLEQELKEKIIRVLKNRKMDEPPGFYEFIKMHRKT